MIRTLPLRTAPVDADMPRPSISSTARYAQYVQAGASVMDGIADGLKPSPANACPSCGNEITPSRVRCQTCGANAPGTMACQWCGGANPKGARRCGERGGQWVASMGCGAEDWGPSWWYDKERLSITITADDSEFQKQMGVIERATRAMQYQMGDAFLPAFERLTRLVSGSLPLGAVVIE